MTQCPYPTPHPIPPAVQEAYGPADLGSMPMFAGGYINFGYWRGIDFQGTLPLGGRQRAEYVVVHGQLTADPVVFGQCPVEAVAWKTDDWPRNFLRAYREGTLDYFTVTAERPTG
ncbi:hypothetical protein [Streptomyces sp. NPDC051162]|uniref:hypothetical protein n=1 Tax=unclassified Streptomyces TaxID=2593676 RepID=UPI00342EC424